MLTIDHVAFGGSELDHLRAAAADVGLPSEYGGPHGNGTTHMAVVGLPDGSYIEFIAPTEETVPDDADFWSAHLAADAGPAGWCIEVSNVAASAKTAIDSGVRVDGPHEASRVRPDGTRVEWDMCFEGPTDDERLPFVIADRTPRSYRTTPNLDLVDSPLVGTALVVLAVEEADRTASLLTRRHRLPTPIESDGPFDRFSICPGAPVAYAETGGVENQSGTAQTQADTDDIASRVDSLGEGPCAYFLAADDFEAATEQFSLTDVQSFGPDGDRRAAWFDHGVFRGRLGVVEL
ncbi:VOC family protein [Halogeometricum borinquense]|uniref:VOC family protein n=1 Tax=Halogeometricum borinquense TaxID=60847 RepID=A0A6C0UH93_9EURY|nr:VOC family protein [Halogeometricum borinquense]QIB74852.1 VOC family protein [Halogeometricum borinquense]QIQ76150.1 VOC family protein [Halogeometricum borinquense]